MRFIIFVICAFTVLAFNSCQQTKPKSSAPTEHKVVQTQQGVASIYTGRRTASGERFSAKSMSAAHKTWSMGTRVRVTHLSTGRHALVRINDRGPYIRGRVIDLTPAAAAAIGLTSRQGIARVKIERLR
jgi:rare lipoprotein A